MLSTRHENERLVQSIQLCLLKQIPLVGKEHVFHTGSSHNCRYIPEVRQRAGGLSLRSTRQDCFFPALNPPELSSRQRSIDWKGPDHAPRMVPHKQSNHPDHDSICHFNVRRVQDEYSVCHQSGSDAIFRATTCQQGYWARWSFFAGEVFFFRKRPTLTKPC